MASSLFEVITRMHPDLYRAAANGVIKDFKEKVNELHLDQILTPEEDTVLHVHITASTTDETFFVEEILKLCPGLLMQTNAKGETPLLMAARYGHARITEFLIESAKADPQQNDLESATAGSEAAKKMMSSETAKKMMRMRSEESDTALHEAVRFRHLQVVRLLTKEDPDFLHSTNAAGETPLYLAAERGYSDVVREILDNCSSPAAGGPNGRTAMQASVIAKDEEITGMILRKPENLTKQADEKGWTPLHYAANLNYVEIVKMLLEDDELAVYIKNEKGMTALHIAASGSHSEVMKEILSRCPDSCELVDNRGRNVLHFAVESQILAAISIILDDPPFSNLLNRKDIDGNTPFLHMAVSPWDNFTLGALFSNSRVDKMAFSKENKNVLDVASTYNGISVTQNCLKRILHNKGIRPGNRIRMHRNDAGKEDDEEVQSAFMSEIERAKQSTLVAATLIATVTFAAGFTLPGGYVSNEGPLQGAAILRKNAAFKAFMITDTLAMLLSTAAVFINLFLISQQEKSRVMSYSLLSFLLTTLAMGAMVIAFVTFRCIGTFRCSCHCHLCYRPFFLHFLLLFTQKSIFRF